MASIIIREDRPTDGRMDQLKRISWSAVFAGVLVAIVTQMLLTLLGKAGIVTAAGLAGVRKFALVAMLVVAAVVTPGPDMTSQIIMFMAVYPLYEISILLVRRIERRREARLRAEGLWVDD